MDTLPYEILYDIIDRLHPQDFISLAIANWPLLEHFGFVPPMSQHLLRRMYRSSLPLLGQAVPINLLPPEILLQIISHLSPYDTMQYIIANYRHFVQAGFAPPPTSALMVRLCNWEIYVTARS